MAGRPRQLTARTETWRDTDKRFDARWGHGWFMPGGPLTEERDERRDEPERLVFWHRNRASWWRESLERQDLAGWTRSHPDPLRHRTFGGSLRGDGLTSCAPGELRSSAASRSWRLALTTHTEIAGMAFSNRR